MDVSLSDSIRTLTYGRDTNAATLALDASGDDTVTGSNGTVITGSASGDFLGPVMAVQVINASGGPGQVFTFTSPIDIPLLAPTPQTPVLMVESETAAISNVTISSTGLFGADGPVAI